MKTLKIISILIVIVGALYYQLDKRLFYFGRNDFSIYNLLPLNIKPEYRPSFEGGFALKDNYGLTIAAKGNPHPVDNKTVLIDRVLRYGFDDNNLTAIVTDGKRNKYYVKFVQDQKDKSVIKAKMETLGFNLIQDFIDHCVNQVQP